MGTPHKKDDVWYANVYKDHATCFGKASILECDQDQKDDRAGIIRYVVDGDTGLLKSSEVVK